MKKFLTAAIVGLALAASGAASAKEWTKVRIASEGAYPPWNSLDPSGKLVGFELDLAKDLCARMKVECDLLAQDWDGMIPALQSGKFDAIMAAMSITDERKEKIDFSQPYASEPVVFGAMKGSSLLTLPAGEVDLAEISADDQKAVDAIKEALKGKTVGVQVSTIHQAMMEKVFPGVELRTYDKTDSAGLDLVAGRIDALVADRSNVESLAQGADAKDLTIFGPNFRRGPLGVGMGVGLRKDDDDLKAKFDQAIAEAQADGTISKLSQQWFGWDASVKK